LGGAVLRLHDHPPPPLPYPPSPPTPPNPPQVHFTLHLVSDTSRKLGEYRARGAAFDAEAYKKQVGGGLGTAGLGWRMGGWGGGWGVDQGGVGGWGGNLGAGFWEQGAARKPPKEASEKDPRRILRETLL
jgi:hypothetical protein